MIVEEQPKASEELDAAMAAAYERGRQVATEILSGPDMIDAEEMAGRLGASPAAVEVMRRSGQLLGLEGAGVGVRYPAWQLDAEGRPYPELEPLQRCLGGSWAAYRFLVQRHGSLGGLSGRRALELGHGRAVLAAAEGVAVGEFT